MTPAATVNADGAHRADGSLRGKLRRRLVRFAHRRLAPRGAPRPMLSLSFDDAPASALRDGAAILEARNARATYFVCAGLDGLTGPLGDYGARADVARAHAAGHEIGCHTFSHMDVGAAPADAVETDLARNRAALAAWGVPEPETFAYPFGDVGFASKAVAAGRFRLARGLHHGIIGRGADLAQTPAVGVEGDEGEALAHTWMDRLVARPGGWLILFSHGVEAAASPFGMSRDALIGVVDRAQAQGVEIVTVAQGAKRLAA